MRHLLVVPAVAALAAAASAQWGPLVTTAAPSPRAGALLAFDLTGNRMLCFGGNHGNELWSLSGATWTQLAPAVLPSARSRASLATDPTNGAIVLYGGNDGSGVLDDTWTWNGTAWQLEQPVATPGGRADHGMAFDSARQAVVVFGGRQGLSIAQQPLAQTWEFAAGTWTQVITAQAPQALLRPAMAYHPLLQGVLLFGGQTGASGGGFGPASDETWTFDGTTWTQINTAGPRPAPRTGANLVWVPSRQVVLLVGGRDPVSMEIRNDTWEHDGVAWREITNVYGGIYPPRADAGVAYDLARDRLVALGGVLANNSLRDDTWEYGAQFQRFGLGCAGSAGTPELVGGVLPRLGAVCSATIVNVPPAIPFAFLAVGVSRTQWAFGSLPALLTPFGMPGCRTYTSLDLLTFVPASGGTATWSFAVPAQPILVGTPFHVQGVTFDPGVNALGLAMSNAATLVIGH